MSQVDTCTEIIIAGNRCTTCTGQPYIPSVPAHVDIVPVLAWTAGANTALDGGPEQKVLDGSLQIADFSVGPCGGLVIGIAAPPRAAVSDPASMTHAWYLTTINRAVVAQPIELGIAFGDPIVNATATSKFAVRRIDEIVTYLADVDGDGDYEIQIVSDTPSFGAVLGASAIFASGDAVQ